MVKSASFLSPGSGNMSPSIQSMELDIPWNPSQVYADLQKAYQILSDRCLTLSAKWVCEQWMGLPPVVEDTTSVTSSLSDDLLLNKSIPTVAYAKTLMQLGEYAHAAAVLSQPCNGVEQMPPPQANLDAGAFCLRAYALYMAGERRKEEEYLELKSEAQKHAAARNPYLQQLADELLEAYEADQLDAFGLHVYGMVLSAGQKSVLPPQSPTPQSVLMKSLLLFPYNWSAWLDLATCALDDRQVQQDIEDGLQPRLSGHCMYHFFCAHLQAEHQSHPDALQIYQRWMDDNLFGLSPFLLTQYAVTQYNLRDYGTSKRLLEDLHQQMPYRLDSMDVYSNILYVQEDAVSLSQLAHTAVQVDKYRAETCCIVGNYYSLKQQRAKAIQYFQRALKVDRTFTSAWTLMGHEFVEWKQTANAMEAYRRAVQVAPGDYRAWYGLGQTYELLNMHLYALYYYKQACQLRPYDARMWAALGLTYVQLHRTEDAIRAYERALQQDDTEGIATQKLAALYKQEGQEEKAAQCYLRHLELRHQVTHPMAAVGSVTLETMLQGLVVEGPEAEALLYLANYHKEHAEYDTAGLFCSRLLEYPGPEKEQAKAMLRELRSRKATGNRRVIHTRSKGPVQDSFEFSP